jgi:N-acetylglucosaminyldiphosphoundecaprenol N-acetyl-beta-D-mannosaminyltransferase
MIGAMAGAEHEVRTCTVMGVNVFVGTVDEAADTLIARALSGKGGYASFTGVHGITLAQRDPGLQHALRCAWMNFPDGAPVAWRQRRTGVRGAQRVAGPDTMPLVVERGREHGLRHYLFGATPDVLEGLEQSLLARSPGALIVGASSPPFRAMTAPEERKAVATIRAAEPHIVWIGLGTPKQDLWMHRLSPDLGPVLALGVGAAFDFLSGNRRRAPVWMQDSGLEWLHRVTQDPVKLVPRYVAANSLFIASTLADLTRRHTVDSARPQR